MTENAVHLAIQHVLLENSAWPKLSFLFYEKLNTYVSLLVSAIINEIPLPNGNCPISNLINEMGVAHTVGHYVVFIFQNT